MKIVADENIPFVAECFSSIGEVITISGREITPEVISNADILLVRSITLVNEKLLADSSARFVATATIGFEHVDIDYLKSRNIGFASAPGSNANSAAEYIIAALLEIGRKHNITLESKSIGIIGVGNVGSRVAKKCAALGMKIQLNDPPLQRYKGHRGHRDRRVNRELDSSLTRIQHFIGDVEFSAVEDIFDCDFITFHTPLTFEGIDKTFHLADEKFFKSLKPGCVFLNDSRGGVVDSIALKQAIKTDKIKAAVLDVWENEPNIDTELLQMADIGTPHIAGYSLDGKIAGMIMIYKAACEYFGLKNKYGIEDFLPEPAVSQIKIDLFSSSEQEILSDAVRKIYDIRKDDANLRAILNEPIKTRGRFFDGLRKNYPVRREFQNTKVLLATEDIRRHLKALAGQAESTEKMDSRLCGNDISKIKTLVDKLKGIGFKV